MIQKILFAVLIFLILMASTIPVTLIGTEERIDQYILIPIILISGFIIYSKKGNRTIRFAGLVCGFGAVLYAWSGMLIVSFSVNIYSLMQYGIFVPTLYFITAFCIGSLGAWIKEKTTKK